jgi:hypothetical protein
LASEALDNLIVRHDFTQMELVFEVQIIAAALERLKELEQQCQTS